MSKNVKIESFDRVKDDIYKDIERIKTELLLWDNNFLFPMPLSKISIIEKELEKYKDSVSKETKRQFDDLCWRIVKIGTKLNELEHRMAELENK